MAEIIPDTIYDSENSTPGEKRLFCVLRDNLLPHEEFVVWYEAKPGNRYTDFIIWSARKGLIVLEIKDWDISTIIKADHKQWTVNINNKEENKESPIEQARRCMYEIKNKIEQNTKFRDLVDFQKRVKFPIGYGIALPNITKRQAEEANLFDVIGQQYIILADDLKFDETKRENQDSFRNKIINIFEVKFSFDPLSQEEMKLLRQAIWPESVIQTVLFNANDKFDSKILDYSQEKLAKSFGAGDYIIQGVAGSGKSIILAKRAKYLARLMPNAKVLVTFFNNSLQNYLASLIDREGAENISIEIVPFLKLAYQLSPETFRQKEEYPARETIGNDLQEKITSEIISRKYDAILIDEAQDFDASWIQALSMMVDRSRGGGLFICYDPAQRIYNVNVPTWSKIGLQMRGRGKTLSLNYRNSKEIAKLSAEFSGVNKKKFLGEGEQEKLETPIPLITTNRKAGKPEIHFIEDFDKRCAYILDKIYIYLNSPDHKYSYGDIAILYPNKNDPYNNGVAYIETLYKNLIKSIGTEHVNWITKDSEGKNNVIWKNDEIKISTIHSAKGLEFKIVFLLGIDVGYGIDDTKDTKSLMRDRSLTYIGITRAQDILEIIAEHPYRHAQEIAEIIDKM